MTQPSTNSAFYALVIAEVCRERAVRGTISDLGAGLAELQGEVADFEELLAQAQPATLTVLTYLVHIGAVAQRVAEDCIPARVTARPASGDTLRGAGEPSNG